MGERAGNSISRRSQAKGSSSGVWPRDGASGRAPRRLPEPLRSRAVEPPWLQPTPPGLTHQLMVLNPRRLPGSSVEKFSRITSGFGQSPGSDVGHAPFARKRREGGGPTL